ncbi:MAG: prohibitin family protein [Anaerolineales bacterium]
MNVAVAIQGLANLSWLAFAGLVVLLVLRAGRRQPVKGLTSGLIAMLVVAVVLTTISAGIVFVEPNESGVVISALSPIGYRQEPLQSGLRWIIPFFERVEFYNISKQTYTMSVTSLEGQVQGNDSVAARTADGQEIFIDASVLFKINPEKVVDVHIYWQKRYADDLVRPLTRGIIRDVVSQYSVDEVVSTRRMEMTSEIQTELRSKLEENGLLLDDFILRNITFSPEYAASVEQKQIAEQQAQQAKFVVEQKKQEAEQARQVAQGKADAAVIASKGDAEARLIQAEAEAKALQMIADVLKQNPDLLTYEYIQKLADNINVMLVPNDNPYLLPLPTPQPEVAPSTPISPTVP